MSKSSSHKSGKPISTVGVDIGSWVLDNKCGRAGSNCGPVIFRTWDFGGQKEYYATHLYFLSRRSEFVNVFVIIIDNVGTYFSMHLLMVFFHAC